MDQETKRKGRRVTRKLDASKIIFNTMKWSKAAVPFIALFTALASAVRTYMTTRDIYMSGGTDPNVAAFVAATLTIGVEGAIFVLALAQEYQEIKWRQARRKRRVLSVASIRRWVLERLGKIEPLSYDQLPERRDLIKVALIIAFSYALISNFNIGIKALIVKVGENTTIQSFIAGLVNARADIQISFFVDMASILFPPFMALVAGILNARFASEIVNSMTRKENKLERLAQIGSESKHQLTNRPTRDRDMNARERVREWLSEHPDVKMSQAKLAKEIGVSVGVVNAILQERKTAEQIGSNGREHAGKDGER